MMIMGADVRRIPRATLTSNDTAVLVDLDLPAYLQNILRLLPETQKLAVVIGNSTIGLASCRILGAIRIERDLVEVNGRGSSSYELRAKGSGHIAQQ